MTSGVGSSLLRQLDQIASEHRAAPPLTREDVDRAIEETRKKVEDGYARYEAEMKGKRPPNPGYRV